MLAHVMERLNDRRAAELDEGDAADAGFTLIELMVVLLILAILLAIAIPTFLGVTGSANDRAAQSNLNTALTSAKGIYESQQQTYPTITSMVADVQKDEPSLGATAATTVSTTNAPQGSVQLYTSSDGNGIVIYSLAKKTDVCWWVADNTSAVADTAGTGYTSPWTAAGSVSSNGTSTTTGVPTAPGTYYGAFLVQPNKNATAGAYCNVNGIATMSSTAKQQGFPAAP